MDGYEAVVYDLDGTLVELDVDWGAVREAVAERLRNDGVVVGDRSLWELLAETEELGASDTVEDTIAEHERAGARASTRLGTADRLPHSIPVGVCSLNCEAACRIALELHELDGFVDAVVGRDSADTHKPDPGPLLATIAALGVEPGETLFVGDSPRDRKTAKRAGVDFKYVSEL